VLIIPDSHSSGADAEDGSVNEQIGPHPFEMSDDGWKRILDEQKKHHEVAKLAQEDIQKMIDSATKPAQCLKCRNVLTWAAQKVQYRRAINRGMTAEQAKACLPRCQKCMTRLLKGAKDGIR
jgi:hypothetical protein